MTSLSQKYINTRTAPQIGDIGPGLLDTSQYLPSTNKRGSTNPIYDQPPAEQPPAEQPPATEPPATEPPATQPPSDGGRGNLPVEPPGNKPGRNIIDSERDTAAKAMVVEYVRNNMPDGNDAAFVALNDRMINGAAKVVGFIPGRTRASRVLARRKLDKYMRQSMQGFTPPKTSYDASRDKAATKEAKGIIGLLRQKPARDK